MIHPSAIVDPKAELAPDVEVGPYTVIGPDVKIDSGCRIGPHVMINGHTTIGKDNRLFQFASIGEEPQDKKYAGEPTELVIGDRNYIREACTFNRGTVQGGGVTRIGNDNWIMACVHIAHDCIVGNNTIFANNASLAGHVIVEDWAILSGYTMVHQYCVVGAHSLLSFASAVNQSIPPYVVVSGEKAKARGINSEGLRRRGYSADQIQNVRRAFRTLYKSGLPLEEALTQLADSADSADEVKVLVEFIQNTERGIIR